jgi:hypothetical protein
VVTPKRLRRARIVLLKVTHAPYVLTIWAFENGDDYFTNAKDGRMISSTTLKGPSALALGRPNAATPQETPRLETTQASIDLAREAAINAGTEDMEGSGKIAENEDLKSLVMKLMAKVDQLSDQLADQK